MTSDSIDKLLWQISEFEVWARRTGGLSELPPEVRECLQDAADSLSAAQRGLSMQRPAGLVRLSA